MDLDRGIQSVNLQTFRQPEINERFHFQDRGVKFTTNFQYTLDTYLPTTRLIYPVAVANNLITLDLNSI